MYMFNCSSSRCRKIFAVPHIAHIYNPFGVASRPDADRMYFYHMHYNLEKLSRSDFQDHNVNSHRHLKSGKEKAVRFASCAL